MPRDFFPRPDDEAVSFARNLRDRVLAEPETFHIDPSVAAQFSLLCDAFADAVRATREPGTATRPATKAKKSARKALEKALRSICGRIRSFPGIPESARISVGVKRRKRGQTRAPRPDTAPWIAVRNVTGHIVSLQLTQRPTGRACMPEGGCGAVILMFAGENPPAAGDRWRFLGQSSRTRFNVVVPDFVPAGTKVHFTAFWVNQIGRAHV